MPSGLSSPERPLEPLGRPDSVSQTETRVLDGISLSLLGDGVSHGGGAFQITAAPRQPLQYRHTMLSVSHFWPKLRPAIGSLNAATLHMSASALHPASPAVCTPGVNSKLVSESATRSRNSSSTVLRASSATVAQARTHRRRHRCTGKARDRVCPPARA